MDITAPFLLFLGDAPYAKTAQGVRDWRPESCIGQLRFPGCPVDLRLPDMDLASAYAAGARGLLIGVAPPGGELPAHWIPTLIEAIERGFDIVNGLHTRLNQVTELAEAARYGGRTLFDVRHPQQTFAIGDFAFRPGKRLLTVGTDCSVGKMYTALAIERELRRRGVAADFRATGQTGIMIAGSGVSVDAVVSDFVSAAAAQLSPANSTDHWDVIEGQGSLFHPAYAGVTLGLLHGSQPDAMVLCTDPSRKTLRTFDRYKQPSLHACIDLYTQTARLTNANAKIVGLSFNTSSFSAAEASRILSKAEADFRLPCVDPVRTGVGRLVDAIFG